MGHYLHALVHNLLAARPAVVPNSDFRSSADSCHCTADAAAAIAGLGKPFCRGQSQGAPQLYAGLHCIDLRTNGL